VIICDLSESVGFASATEGDLLGNQVARPRLAGKRIIVTGASGGQGVAVARRFADEGARLCLTDVDQPALSELGDALAARGYEVITRPADIRQEAEVQAVVTAAAEAFGGLDVLYNNAGIRWAGRDGPVDGLELDVWNDTLAVNATGSFLFSKHALPLLLRERRGVLINVSSTAGLGGDPEAHAYAASKGALIALTRSIAQRFGDSGLRAVVLCPGLIETPMLDAALEGEAMTRDLLDAIALGRIGTSDEVAAVAAFLASDDASYLTSCVVEVHGGLVK
jgi:NAD(P)-dependent dehydrogenase (short-subunit alcohol dehydrogenase family)